MILKFKIGRSKVADAPKPININENPRTKKTDLTIIDFRREKLSELRISTSDAPVKKHR